MYIQCFIKKVDDSPVFVDYEGVRYIFQRNEFGHAVCFVGNQMHVRRLLKMGPACYIKYVPPEAADQTTLLGAAPVPMGGQQKRAQTNPLPDGLSVDDALTQPPGDINNPAAGAGITPEPEAKEPESTPVDWADPAKEAKIKEFKFLQKDGFKAFVDNNRDDVMGWPEEVKSELAKKLVNLFPDDDPDIEGFDVNDYYGRGATINS